MISITEYKILSIKCYNLYILHIYHTYVDLTIGSHCGYVHSSGNAVKAVSPAAAAKTRVQY